MLPSVKDIKKTAKAILSKNHFSGIIASMPLIISFLIFCIVTDILSSVTNGYISLLIGAMMILFLLLPLFAGTLKFFARCADNVYDYPSTVFVYFSSKKLYVKTLNFIISVAFRLILSGLALAIPGLIVRFFSIPFFYETIGIAIPLWIPILSTVSSLLLILALIVFLFVNLKYYLAGYIFAVDGEVSPKKAMKLSVIISRRTQVDYIFLVFGMWLYILLSLFVVPLFITLPILFTVYIVHSKCAVLQYNSTIDAFK